MLYPTPLNLEEIICGKPRHDALRDIIDGISKDMKEISQNYYNDMLFIRVF